MLYGCMLFIYVNIRCLNIVYMNYMADKCINRILSAAFRESRDVGERLHVISLISIKVHVIAPLHVGCYEQIYRCTIMQNFELTLLDIFRSLMQAWEMCWFCILCSLAMCIQYAGIAIGVHNVYMKHSQLCIDMWYCCMRCIFIHVQLLNERLVVIRTKFILWPNRLPNTSVKHD
jgi:hypothetical protein